jgi:large subunit ribosomal protein L17
MRHQARRHKLGRTSKHRESLLANLAVGLITHDRITTTLAKAKAVRPFAEKLVTLGKGGTLAQRRLAASRLNDVKAVKKLFSDIGPRFKERAGGYTRIYKLGYRKSDAAEMALIEFVGQLEVTPAAVAAPEATQAVEAPVTLVNDPKV